MLSITVLLLFCVAYCSLNARTSRSFCSSFVYIFRSTNSSRNNAKLPRIGSRTFFAMNDSKSISSLHGKGDDANDHDEKYLKTKTSQEVICHPVLRQVYPDLMAHKIKFGHPNLPLGSSAGRKCSTLRRLYLQNQLTVEEVALLQSEGFVFLSFDNIYNEADFDKMFQRLKSYEAVHNNSYQIPKKYPYDLQLGAWVTNLRRLGTDGVDPEHLEKLNSIQFSWTSKRKCGSSFMANLRQVQAALEGISNAEDAVACLSPEHKKWLVAQREASAKGNLNEMRVGYINKLCQDYKIDFSSITKV